MERRVLFELPVKKQIARARIVNVARHEVRIEVFESFGVGKLREGAILEVGYLKFPRANPEQRRPERCEGIAIFFQRGQRRWRFDLRLAEPVRIVSAQSVS